MADRIKGITIEIGGDTSKLSDSLKDVNKSIKNTQAELKDVDKLLKIDPKNLDLLVQKQELLSKATEETKEKLEKLKQAQEQMNANGVDQSSAEYRALTREIAATEQEMQKLEKTALETDKAILKVASGAEKVADATGKMSKATANLSKAAGGALAGLVGLGIKSASDADDLNTLAKQTGLSTEALQEMQYASSRIDVDVEDITSAAKRMKKQLDSGAKKFQEIGVATKDANGNFRSTEDIFNDVIVALGKIENETERDVVAMDLFGKSADELAGLIDDGGAAFRALSEEAKASGTIISQEQLDKANELNDTLDKLKAEAGASLAQLGITLAETLIPVMESLAPLIESVAEKLRNMNPTTLKVIEVILALVAALSPVLGLISSVAGALPILIPMISGVGTAVTTVVGIIGAPLLGAIAAVVAAILVWINHWDDIKEAVRLVGEIIVEFYQDKVVPIFDKIKTAFQEVVDFFKDGVKKIEDFFKNMVIKFPEIKLPHFSIDGTMSFNPPSVPKIKVDWYKKAYDEAYLLDSPTIFGAAGGNLLGGGEGNGSEAIVGTDKLMAMMTEAVGNANINVAVVLEGEAQGVFNLVRTENNRFMKSNGYSPLTG